MTGSGNRPGLFTPAGRTALRAELRKPGGAVASLLGLIALLAGGAMLLYGMWVPGAPAGLGAAGTGMVVLGWVGLIGGFVLTNIHNRRRAADGSGNADA
jgi:CHASE2 domain-containing sensor protein